MKSMIHASIIVITFLLFPSCIGYVGNSITGNGNVTTEYREVGSFHGIEASAGLKVFVIFGEMRGEVEVVADENLHEHIIVEVDNEILKIRSRRNIRNASSKDIFVKAGEIDELEVSSAARLIGENVLITDNIDIEVSSAAELDLNLEANSIHIEVSSSGSANMEGSVFKLIADVSSAGDLDAYQLIAEEGNIEASSAADAKVHITGKLKAAASSAGSIRYEGNPGLKETDSSSAGSISAR